MLNRVMEWSVRNKLIVALFTTAAILGGVWAMSQTPLEALPDLSDVQVIVQADAQKSRTTTSAFAGFRVLYTAGGFSTLSTIGHATLKDGGTRGSRSRQVGSLSGQWFYQDDERTQVSPPVKLITTSTPPSYLRRCGLPNMP